MPGSDVRVFPPMPGDRPSLRDIAARLGVSHVTVSMALRDHPRISVTRRAEIRALAESMGYRPDPMLASLVAYRNRKSSKPITATIGWLNRWPDPSRLRAHGEFDAYWQGAASAAEALGYRLEEFVVGSGLTASRLHGILSTRSVFGLLVPPHPPSVDWTDFELPFEQYSVVRFGFSVSALKVHLVGNDQMRSSELAVRRMAELGYRRIGFVIHRQTDETTDGNFRVGYLRGVETVEGMSSLAPLVLPRPLSRDDAAGVEAVATWVREHRPDAILTTETRLRAVLEELGFDVPGTIGLASTTVRDVDSIDAGLDQNPVEIGRVAVRTVVELINSLERGFPRHCRRILVESRWVDGASLPPRRPVAAAPSRRP